MTTFADRSKNANSVKPTTFIDGVRTVATETELREAIDDLWGCIGINEVLKLQPKTLLVGREVHDSIWHADVIAVPSGFVDGTARLERLMQRPGFAEKVAEGRLALSSSPARSDT